MFSVMFFFFKQMCITAAALSGEIQHGNFEKAVSRSHRNDEPQITSMLPSQLYFPHSQSLCVCVCSCGIGFQQSHQALVVRRTVVISQRAQEIHTHILSKLAHFFFHSRNYGLYFCISMQSRTAWTTHAARFRASINHTLSSQIICRQNII